MAESIGRAAVAEDVRLVVSQGADNDYVFQYLRRPAPNAEPAPVDLTGWAARLQFRRAPGAEVWLSVTTDAPSGDTTLSVDADGFVRFHLHHATTEAQEWNAASRRAGRWDLELVDPDGEVLRLAMGPFELSQDVTRND